MSRREEPVGGKEARIRMLAKVPLLAGLSRRDLRQVLELASEVEFLKGSVIVKAGDEGRDFYLILQGKAKLSVPGKASMSLGPGDYFGEMAVLDGGLRSATITAETRVWALDLDRPQFLSMLDDFGSIGRKILVELSKRVRAAERPADRL